MFLTKNTQAPPNPERNENAPSGMLGAFKQIVRPEGFEPPTF